MRAIVTFFGVLFMSACSGILQTASISEAYKKYESQQYRQTLTLIARAENAKSVAPETKAELTFLKAKTYEEIGQTDKAMALYFYLKEQHRGSQYSYLANQKLEKMKINSAL